VILGGGRATNNACERMHSAAGIASRKLRAAIKPENLEMLVLARHHLKSALATDPDLATVMRGGRHYSSVRKPDTPAEPDDPVDIDTAADLEEYFEDKCLAV
jgi:hypothetical protein